MATFYVDFVNGNDANAGTSWATAIKTIGGVTAGKGLTGGDTVRVAKTPDKVSIGNGTWTTGPIPDTKSIVSSTNASPIQVTVTGHGYSTGDVVQILNHTVNTAANGVWIITSTGTDTFTLDGSTGNGTGAASGTARNINAKTVKLATAQTKTVFNCDTQFTAVNSASVASITSTFKQGSQATAITTPSTGTAQNTRYAYFTLPGGAQDFSAYQELSFWVSHANFLTNNSFRVCLCSDTLGLTIVDDFAITAGAVQNSFNPLSLTRAGGGNLGSSIQSIAIYTGTDIANSRTITFDNFVACTTNGLNLTGVISPIASNTDPYENYPIQSISDTLVLIDQHYPNSAGAGRGYFGTTQTTTTYYRQPNSNTALYSAEANLASIITPAVIPTNPQLPITYSGGWNTATDTQDGMTVIQTGANNHLWNLYSYINLENMGARGGASAFRYAGGGASFYSGNRLTNCFATATVQNAFQFNAPILSASTIGSGYMPIELINCGGNNTNLGGIAVGAIFSTKITGCKTNNSFNPGLVANGIGDLLIDNCVSNNTVGYGLSITNVSQGNVTGGTFASNTTGGIFLNNVSDSLLVNVTTNSNAQTSSPPAGILEVGPSKNNRTVNLTANETVPYQAVANTSFSFTKNTNGNGLIEGWSSKGWLQQDFINTHGSSPFSWKYINIGSGSVSALSDNPAVLDLAQVYVTGGQSTTIKAWFNKSNATNISAQLFVPASPIYGTIVSTTAANSTGWQEVSITFTPTITGVIQLQAKFWVASPAVANNNLNCLVTDLTLPVGVNTASLAYDNLGEPWAQNQSSSAVSVAYGAVGL